jgi:CDP-glucose 4,6-dehydratase
MESLGMNPDFWRDKRVFLTGHTGFKGSWLSLWLQRLGAQLSGYSLAVATKPSLFEQAKVSEHMVSQIADIRDLPALKAALESAQPEVVFHLAAQPLVRASYLDPVGTYSTNVMGTVHLLEAIRHCPSVKAVVIVTTDKCYENQEWHWAYRETEPMGGYDPYSSSKGCAELVSAAFRKSYFSEPNSVAIATARAGNVLGGGDWSADRLVPDTLAAFAKNQPVQLRYPHAIRPWQHVLEPLRGYLMLAQALCERGQAFAQAWNFGPCEDDAQTVQWIVEKMAYLWGADANYEVLNSEQPHEAHLLKLDISKAKALLKWAPTLRLNQALDLTVQWSKQQLNGDDARQLCLEQIQHYELSL